LSITLSQRPVDNTSRIRSGPPHAKFHNAQTILMGFYLGVLAIAILFVHQPLSMNRLVMAAILSSLYWVGIFGARIFPGTAWADPEFEATTPKPLGLHPQQLIGFILVGVLLAAIALALLSSRSA
jgi:apolipoprotein N-acyltransferase